MATLSSAAAPKTDGGRRQLTRGQRVVAPCRVVVAGTRGLKKRVSLPEQHRTYRTLHTDHLGTCLLVWLNRIDSLRALALESRYGGANLDVVA